jgi:hypothetical protein
MSSSAEPTTLVLVPDEKGFRELVDGIEEPLLLQIAATEEADRQSEQPYVLPAPIADGVALQAWDRVHRTLQDRRVPPTGYRLLAPGGGYQHRRLHVAAVATSDLEVLESALRMLLRALLPDDEPDLTDLLAQIAIDYSTSPVNMVGELARVLAVLRLTSEETTAVLVEALTTNSASVAGDVVLTDEQESAYQQTVRRMNRLLAVANPIDLYRTDRDGHPIDLFRTHQDGHLRT